MGIEPTTSAWKAEVLPLNYTRRKIIISTTKYKQLKHIYNITYFSAKVKRILRILSKKIIKQKHPLDILV